MHIWFIAFMQTGCLDKMTPVLCEGNRYILSMLSYTVCHTSQEKFMRKTHCDVLEQKVYSFVFQNQCPEAEELIFSHFVVCNDTQEILRFGQVDTDENIVLASLHSHQYCWRSHKSPQVQPEWFPSHQYIRFKPFIHFLMVSFLEIP